MSNPVRIGEYTQVRLLPSTLEFVSTDFVVESLKQYIPSYLSDGKEFSTAEYDSFFVELADGDYGEVYGMIGIIPWLDREVCRIL